VDWIQLAQNAFYGRALMSAVSNLCFLWQAVNFLRAEWLSAFQGGLSSIMWVNLLAVVTLMCYIPCSSSVVDSHPSCGVPSSFSFDFYLFAYCLFILTSFTELHSCWTLLFPVPFSFLLPFCFCCLPFPLVRSFPFSYTSLFCLFICTIFYF
jgi:hypothetical protein